MPAESTLSRARDDARRRTADEQERNRLWWESLPMTYVGWEDADRVPSAPDDFRAVDRQFLRGNPWLERDFDFAAHADGFYQRHFSPAELRSAFRSAGLDAWLKRTAGWLLVIEFAKRGAVSPREPVRA